MRRRCWKVIVELRNPTPLTRDPIMSNSASISSSPFAWGLSMILNVLNNLKLLLIIGVTMCIVVAIIFAPMILWELFSLLFRKLSTRYNLYIDDQSLLRSIIPPFRKAVRWFRRYDWIGLLGVVIVIGFVNYILLGPAKISSALVLVTDDYLH